MNHDLSLGTKITSIAITLLGQIAAAAIAMCFSTVWIAVLVYLISALVLGLLSMLVAIYVNLAHTDKVEALGAAVGKAASKVRGLFARKAVSHD